MKERILIEFPRIFNENFISILRYIDQTRPLHFSQKKRSCHVKFMAIDDQVAIMGSGNIDTQSWFHSQVRNNTFWLTLSCVP
jgi:phosphatidylserine/phosphatidylglycerophosphate/cardiolipin synthase-like enzyme